jgi:hypothetical protein
MEKGADTTDLSPSTPDDNGLMALLGVDSVTAPKPLRLAAITTTVKLAGAPGASWRARSGGGSWWRSAARGAYRGAIPAIPGPDAPARSTVTSVVTGPAWAKVTVSGK